MSAIVLADLVTQINAEHDIAESSAQSAIEHARRAGELLLQAKETVGHGAWLEWLAANVRVGTRMAQNYMRLATELGKLSSEEAQRVAYLPLRAALTGLSRCATATAFRCAALSPESQASALAATDAGLTISQAIRAEVQKEHVAKLEAARKQSSQATEIAHEGRPARALYNSKLDIWRLEFGSNCSGAEFEAAIEDAKETIIFTEYERDAAELETRAEALEKEAKALRAKAANRHRAARHALVSFLHVEHASLCPWREQFEFGPLGADKTAQLKAGGHADAARLLIQWLPNSEITDVSIAGDMSWLNYSTPLGMRAPLRSKGWHGIGFEACVEPERATEAAE